MSDLEQERTAKLTARRRLLRGSFAAPAVLTVCSGSTFAQAASSLSCVNKQVNQVKDTVNSATSTTASTGNWVRVPLKKLAKSDGTVDSVWVDGSYIAANIQKSGTTSYLGSTSWQCYRKVKGDSLYVQGNIYTAAPARNYYSLSANGEWVAVLVDQNGNIKGVIDLKSPSATNGYPVHATSCWSSFRPGYIKPW